MHRALTAWRPDTCQVTATSRKPCLMRLSSSCFGGPTGSVLHEDPDPWARSISTVAMLVNQSRSCVAELIEPASGGENSDDITRGQLGVGGPRHVSPTACAVEHCGGCFWVRCRQVCLYRGLYLASATPPHPRLVRLPSKSVMT